MKGSKKSLKKKAEKLSTFIPSSVYIYATNSSIHVPLAQSVSSWDFFCSSSFFCQVLLLTCSHPNSSHPEFLLQPLASYVDATPYKASCSVHPLCMHRVCVTLVRFGPQITVIYRYIDVRLSLREHLGSLVE